MTAPVREPSPDQPARGNTTGTAASAGLVGKYNGEQWEHVQEKPKQTDGLIACRVGYDNELHLYPLTALGESVLAQMMHGKHEFAGLFRGGAEMREGRGIQCLTITRRMDALLTSGGDPYFTGMTLSPDEQKACRAIVDKMRAAKTREMKKQRRARGPGDPSA